MATRATDAVERRASPLGGEALALLAQSVMALRTTSDLATASAIICDCALHALDAADVRVLRMDPRGGALRALDGDAREASYLAEPGGAVEWAGRHDKAVFDDGIEPGAPTREALLWRRSPAALATIPVFSRGTPHGYLLVAFDQARPFTPDERLFLQTLGDALGLRFEREELRSVLEASRLHARELERQRVRDEDTAAGLVAAVAAQMRAPVGTIQAYAETLRDALGNPRAPRERFISTIEDECASLGRLISDVLELSRLEAGQRPLRVQSLELGAVLYESVAALRSAWEGKRVSMDVHVPTGLVVEADPDLVGQLWQSLLPYAIRHAPEGSTVQLEAGTDGEDWVATLADQGADVPGAELSRVFERFSRTRESSEPGGEGPGLGLAIARSIVELHGGRIEVESGPGQGCRFRMRMPLRQVAGVRARRVAKQALARADVASLLRATLDMVATAVDGELSSLLMVDAERGDLFMFDWRGFSDPETAHRRVPMRAGVAGTVAAWGTAVRVENIETDRRFRRLNHPQYTTKSLLCVPLRVGSEVVGVFNVTNKRTREIFSEDDFSVMAALVDRVGSVLERGLGGEEGPEMIEEALDTVRAVTAVRRENQQSGVRLVRWSRAVAREMLLPPADVDQMGYVASVHDVGMARLDGLLPEAGRPLDANDRYLLMQHPEVGAEVIRPLEYQAAVREAILAHHEWWDGSGYPRGIRGEEIPVAARILAVVDAYESMTAGRPHRSPVGYEEALTELRRYSGRQFDPETVEALVRVLERERRPW